MSPYASREAKISMFDRILGGKIDPIAMQLLHIVFEKRREQEIPALYEEFVTLRRAYEEIAHVVVTSAEELDATQRAAVNTRLESILKKRIEPTYDVDPKILGGVRVKYENMIMDGSVRGSLTRLKETLKRDVLKQA
jgi:F-type H+-transporting ATPase subunit delta